ncbi:hypothetical protein CI109_100088 [Kwoniella shandongensis]|uniref:GATA-type domain-containing protein n=1 Tax=Kwoniella shandongensis TaxID=1734106 RepID=A0AAJ8LE79_9TREE
MHHPYAPNAGPSSSSNSNSNSNHGYGQQGGGRMGSTSSAGWQTNPASHSESNMGYQQPGSYGGLPSYANHSSASSGYGGAKGKLRESSGSFADYERDFKRSRVESEMPIDVERETEQIKVYLTQLISLIEPFAPNSTTTAPSPPPPYLFTRFARLSSLIHSTLVALAPHVHPFLSSEFTTSFVDIIAKPSPPVEQSIPASPVVPIKKLEDMTPAEREMEVIRKRRDALIAKAASAATTLPSGLKNGTLSHSFGGRNGLSEQSSLSSMGNLSALTEAAAAVASASTTYPLHQQQQQNQQMLSLDMLSPRSLTLMGRCHGCGSSVTREWRRGPDGPESLCDTCGMHYARLLKKKDMPTPTGSNEEEASTPVFGMTNGGGVQVT